MSLCSSIAPPHPPTIELEHAIGYNAGYGNCVAKRGGTGFYYVAGGCVVSGSTASAHQQQFMRATEETVGLLAITNSGKRVVTAQVSGSSPDVVVWCTETERILFRITEHDHGVAAIAVTQDDRLLLTVGNHQDRRVVVWDMSTGGMVAVTQIPATDDTAQTSCCAWGGRVEDVKRRPTDSYHFMLASGTHVHRFHVCPFKQGVMTPVRTNTGNLVRNWTSAAYSRHGDLLFLGSETGDVCVINTLDGKCIKSLKIFNAGVRFILCEDTLPEVDDDTRAEGFQYARFGGHSVRTTNLRIGGAGGELCRCVVTDHTEASMQVTHEHTLSGPVNSIAKCGDGVVAGTAAGDIYKVQDGQQPTHLSSAPLAEVLTVAFPSARSDTFASGSADGVFRVWDLSSYFQTCHGGVGRGDGRRAKGTQDTHTVLAEGKFGGQGGGVGGRQAQCKDHMAMPLCIQYVGDTDTALTGWSDGSIRCFDTIDGEMHWEVQKAHTGACTSVVLASTLAFFVTSGAHGEIKVWSLQTRQLQMELKEHKSKVTCLQLFDNDTHLLSCSHDRSVLTWQLSTGQRVATNMLQMGQINSMFLCKNQQNFITTGTDKKVSLWDTRQHETVKQAHIGSQYSDVVATTIAGSHSDKYFATGGTDQVVTMWDTAQFTPIQTGVGHTGTVNQVCFSPDDKQVLSCGNDRSVLVWNFYE